jgi:RNA 2',3'-cyclic 3'-phosphodiesterase
MNRKDLQARGSRNSIRTFVCIEVPAPIKDRIGRLQDELRTLGCQVSWVKPSNIHLTLKFLGEISISRLPRVSEAVELAAKSIRSFEISISGTGCFPSSRNPRVLWVGMNPVAEELKHLNGSIEDFLSRSGFDRESKAFSPHLTIGRVRSPQASAQVAERLVSIGFDLEAFFAREVIVMRSDLSPTGSVYTPQAVIQLAS